MKRFYSIVIPIYNVEKYLGECLDSLLNQTFSDWEAICVDDGSTDNSGLILDQYTKLDSRIIKISKPNGGLASARNAALEHINGEWVAFIDSDDKIESKWLEEASRLIKIHNPDLVRQNFKFWDPDKTQGERLWTTKLDAHQIIEGPEETIKWGLESLLNGAWVWRYFLRSEVLKCSHVIFPEAAIVKEDVVFGMNILPFINKVVQGEYCGYLYRVRSDSLWRKPRSLKACNQFLDDVMSFWPKVKNLAESYGLLSLAEGQMAVALWCDLLEWVVMGVRNERVGDKALIMRYISCGKNYNLWPRSDRLRWAFGVWWLKRFHSFQVLYMTQSAISIIRGLLKV